MRWGAPTRYLYLICPACWVGRRGTRPQHTLTHLTAHMYKIIWSNTTTAGSWLTRAQQRAFQSLNWANHSAWLQSSCIAEPKEPENQVGNKAFWWKRFRLYLGPKLGVGDYPPWPPPCPRFRRSCLPSWSARVYDTAQFKIKAHYFYFFPADFSNFKFLHIFEILASGLQILECKLISNSFKILLPVSK